MKIIEPHFHKLTDFLFKYDINQFKFISWSTEYFLMVRMRSEFDTSFFDSDHILRFINIHTKISILKKMQKMIFAVKCRSHSLFKIQLKIANESKINANFKRLQTNAFLENIQNSTFEHYVPFSKEYN